MAVVAVAALIFVAAVSAADLHSDDEGEKVNDHDLAIEALRAGEIVSLRDILDIAAARMSGELIEVELERLEGRWVYEVEFILPDGRIVRTVWDAKTTELLLQEDGFSRMKAEP